VSCINIPPLILSDTFNTWFERTNQTITALNSIQTRGLSASSYNGLKLTSLENCYYDLSLSTGPFLGFVTSGPTSDYGSGTLEDPYKLTLVATGPTMTEPLEDGDYAFVSDSSDSSKIKLASVNSFVTKITAGSSISVSFNSNTNTYTISYVEISFNPSFVSIQDGNNTLQTSSSSVYEAIANNSSSILSGTLIYTISDNSSDVNVASVEVKCLDISRILGNALASGSAAGQLPTSSVTVPYNVGTWFGIGSTTIRFQAGMTSSGTAIDGTIVSPLLTDTETKTAYFGWKFGGCDSTISHNNTQGFLSSGLTNDLSDMTIAGSSPPWSASSPSNRIYNDPTIVRPFRIEVGSNNSHIYFVHSSSPSGGNEDNYGWSPKLYNDAGTSEITNGLIELGVIQIGSGYYRVWKSANIYNQGTLNFNIGGNNFGQ